MTGWSKQGAIFSVAFEHLCPGCGSHSAKDFIIIKKGYQFELLCKTCERKFRIKVHIEEIK